MARKVSNIHYIYKTTCNVTKKWYVGMHSTNNLDDGYMGSGTILRHSIRKHGKTNHTKEILEYCDTRELLAKREREIVNQDLISDGFCMNLKEGGDGGGGFWSDKQMMNCSKAGNKAFIEKLKTDKVFKDELSKKHSETNKKLHSTGKLTPINESYDWNGKNHSEKTKEKMSNTSKDMGVGEVNSQYGTCWVTKGCINKKIKTEEINIFEEDGWVKGRYTEINGELVSNAKLTIDDVKNIKEMLKNNISNVNISKNFNVKPETISKIKRGVIWAHIN